MAMIEALLQELEHEARTTRRVLERVPGDQLAWKPHAKSMSLGQLALHVATTPGAVAAMAQQSPYQVGNFQQASATSAAELLPAHDDSVAKARAYLSGMTDAELAKTWRAVFQGTEIMALPLGVMLRGIMFNHWYHHRGQLSVYLRQVGALVPSIYGPSADENPFQVSAA
ncbi:MAG: DinB family protein [Acidobacteria bacterium]|nr:DinB family protein [Acidobacteriota bacterium]